MSAIEDGGPAYPAICRTVGGLPLTPGVSIIDYFATHVDLGELIESDGLISLGLAVDVMGGAPPHGDADAIAAAEWWFEAEARVRYMKAAAMLKVRSS